MVSPITTHNSPIYGECQTQSAWVLALPGGGQAHQDDSRAFLGVLAKTQSVQNAKTQFESAKTQFQNAKTLFEN